MLLRFSAANFKSLRDRQELSLVPAALKDTEEALIPGFGGRGILPMAIIYGANASGKSNILNALFTMRSVTLFSHSMGSPEGELPHRPFLLDEKYSSIPTAFDIDFAIDETRYHYGFEYSEARVECEWLYSFQGAYQTTLFRREGQDFSFGRSLKGRNRVIADLTRPNSLFLSAAAQNDHEQLGKVLGFFRSMLVDRNISVPGRAVSMQFAEKGMDKRVIRFLEKVGTGVVDFHRKELEIPEDLKSFQKAFADLLKKHFDDASTPPERRKEISVELAHRNCDGAHVFFDIDDESAGTLRLLMLVAAAYTALDEGALLLIDELDASLHTQACEAVLALFSSAEANPKGAQLVATTHDTNLLRSKFLRRDQIWFTEKDDGGTTHIYPLTDFRTRVGDNVERGYLQGRYGAIPFAGSVAELFDF